MKSDELEFKLQHWVAGRVPTKLITTVKAWYLQVKLWLELSLKQQNPLECDEQILELLAWERRIKRFSNEPTDVYRRRINYAYVNERDAGSAIGLERIFSRLGVGFVTIEERSPLRDWDVIALNVNDEEFSQNNELLTELVGLYGRTCRRYEFTTSTVTGSHISVNSFSSGSVTLKAKASI